MQNKMTYHQKKIKEEYLRSVVRQAFGKSLEWVEPAFGSTPGLPDCNLDIGQGLSISVELKIWEYNKKEILVSWMRPAQIRYHIMGARKGKRSAILFAVPLSGTKEDLVLFLLNGKYAPKDRLDHQVREHAVKVGDTTNLKGSIRYFITKTLNDEAFWS